MGACIITGFAILVALSIISLIGAWYSDSSKGIKISCTITIIIAIAAFLCAYIRNPFEFKDGVGIVGIIATIMSIPIAVLIGWNIFDALTLKNEWKGFNNNWNHKIVLMQQEIDSLSLEKYNQRALNASTSAQMCIMNHNFPSALNCCLQSLNNMLYDPITNLRLGNFKNLKDWFNITLYDENGSFRGSIYSEDVEYVSSLIENIEKHPNYPIVKELFDDMLEKIKGILNKQP